MYDRKNIFSDSNPLDRPKGGGGLVKSLVIITQSSRYGGMYYFNMLFVTFGGGPFFRLCTTCALLFLSLSLTHFLGAWTHFETMDEFRADSTHIYVHICINIYKYIYLYIYIHITHICFFFFRKTLHFTARTLFCFAFLFNFSLSLCSSTSRILTIHFIETSTWLEIPTRSATYVQERNSNEQKSGEK